MFNLAVFFTVNADKSRVQELLQEMRGRERLIVKAYLVVLCEALIAVPQSVSSQKFSTYSYDDKLLHCSSLSHASDVYVFRGNQPHTFEFRVN
jgi:hypothetical protein